MGQANRKAARAAAEARDAKKAKQRRAQQAAGSVQLHRAPGSGRATSLPLTKPPAPDDKQNAPGRRKPRTKHRSQERRW